MLPTECNMEDLSGLDDIAMALFMNTVFAGADKGLSRRTQLSRRLYVRLVDKCLEEYELARKQVLAQIAERDRSAEEMAENGRVIYMFSFVDYMENCIATIRRALRFLDTLKGSQEGLVLPRSVRKQIESLTQEIVEVRNVVEHMDEEIRNDSLREDESLMFRVTDDQKGVTVGGKSVQFFRLSTLIKKLHSVGKLMAEWNPNKSKGQ